MSAIFLSASVPVIGRGHYHESSNPFLIQCAVRELIMAVVRTHKIVWGGHPSITPMLWTICQDLGVEYSERVVLYQSAFFEDRFPEENARFRNVRITDSIDNDRESSLLHMRTRMLSRRDLQAAVFIGGMDGVEHEHELFRRFHPNSPLLALAAPGGAAKDLVNRERRGAAHGYQGVDFARFFHEAFGRGVNLAQ